MPKTEPTVHQSRVVWLVLKAWFFLASFGTLWWYLGAITFAVVLAWAVIMLLQRVIPTRPAGKAEAETSGQILSANPTEARTARQRITSSLVLGLGCYPLFVSSILVGFSGVPFWIVLAAVASAMVFTATMFLVWIATWTLSHVSRWSQFSISTLLFLTTISAVYLGVIRLLADLSDEQLTTDGNPFLAITVACLVLVGFSLPILIIFLEQLVWLPGLFAGRRFRRGCDGKANRRPAQGGAMRD